LLGLLTTAGKKAYGFRTFRIAEIALYHALGNLHSTDEPVN
jgi:hypothetical protein